MKNKFSIQENSYLWNIGKSSARIATKLRDEPRSIVIFSDDVVHKTNQRDLVAESNSL